MFKKVLKAVYSFFRLLGYSIVYPFLEIGYHLKKKRLKKNSANFTSIHPVTIVKDRYNGSYSGGMYLAFNLDHYDLPDEIDDGDVDCMNFWVLVKHTNDIVGIGATPNDAFNNLLKKLESKSHKESLIKNEIHQYGQFKFEINQYVIADGHRQLIVDRYIENFKPHYMVSLCRDNGCGYSQYSESQLKPIETEVIDNDRQE